MNPIFFLSLILILSVGLPLLFNFSNKEGYSNYSLDQSTGNVPDSQNTVLVQDTYPPIGGNQISNNTSNDIWWHFPTFTLGSYKQITNHIRYPNNPDEGTCMPASMCGALYKEKSTGDNYIKQLPPVNPEEGTRVGYFTTPNQLIDSLPFRNNTPNVLY